MSDVRRTYTQCEIDLNVARTVWELIDFLEHSSNPPEMIGVCIEKDEETDKIKGLSFTNYEPGDESKNQNMIAAMSVEPFSADGDERSENEDPDLVKSMKFMYFYQAITVTLQKAEMGLL